MGENFVSPNASSIFSPAEVFQTIDYLVELFELGFNATDIGIITPYRQQVFAIILFVVLFPL